MATGTPRVLLRLLLLVGCAALPWGVRAQAGVSRVVCTEEPAALWSDSSASAERIGVVAYQTPLSRLAEHAERSRVALPSLPLSTALWISRDAVGAYATQTARVRGPAVSVRRSDLVCVRTEDTGGGRALILVRTSLDDAVRLDSHATLESDRGGQQLWVGTYPRSGLAGVEPQPGDRRANANVQALAASTVAVEVFESPGGRRILSVLPGASVPAALVQQEGRWSAVRIGEGPFVVGYTQAPLRDVTDLREQARRQAMELALQTPGSPHARFSNAVVGGPSVSSILRTQETAQRLATLRAGAALHIAGGEVVTPSHAVTVRVGAMESATGRVRVLAALTDDIALYGMVSSVDLMRAP